MNHDLVILGRVAPKNLRSLAVLGIAVTVEIRP